MNERLAYLTGLFDGEGSCCIQVRQLKNLNFIPRMSISLKYGQKVFDLFVQEFGGKLYYYEDNMIRWHLGKIKLMKQAIEKMLPYLVIKKEIAQRFLDTLNLFPANKKTWTEDLRYRVCQVAYTLNPETSRKVKAKNIIIFK